MSYDKSTKNESKFSNKRIRLNRNRNYIRHLSSIIQSKKNKIEFYSKMTL